MKFRKDINGLRALAVLAVVLFHFKLLKVSGGFIGVDIFFVISGFFMTGIIVDKIATGSFSLTEFYLARARRIIPALVGLVTVLLIFGYFCLPSFFYEELGKEIRYALPFLSNVLYWSSSGYFDTAAQEKWLLHTWSLAVEWQFYIFFPLYLLLAWKWYQKKYHNRCNPQTMFFMSLCIPLVLSLATSVFLSSEKAAFSFYLPFTRIWELLAGGLVYLLQKRLTVSPFVAKSLFAGGGVVLIGSCFFFSEKFSWPGGWAMIPVVASMLVIFARRDTVFTNTPIAQWLGDRSYSLYLYHWPFVAALYYSGYESSYGWIAVSIIGSLTLAHLSYLFIENPIRATFKNIRNTPKKLLWIGSILAFGCIGPIAIKSEMINIDDDRLLDSISQVVVILKEKTNRGFGTSQSITIDEDNNITAPLYGTKDIGAMLIGDSHSSAVVTALGEAAEKHGRGVIYLGRGGCPSIDGVEKTDADYNCRKRYETVFKQVQMQAPDIPVVMVNRTSFYNMGGNELRFLDEPQGFISERVSSYNVDWFQKEYQQHLIKTLCDLAQSRVVYIMNPIPEMGVDVPQTVAKRHFRGDTEEVFILKKEYYKRHKVVLEAQEKAEQQCGIKILDPLPYLCDEEKCYGSRKGKPLYFDDDHLSEYGNKLLTPMFEEVFSETTEAAPLSSTSPHMARNSQEN